MAGKTPSGLPWPEDRYRIDRHSQSFETEAEAARQDAIRAHGLRKTARKQKGKSAERMLRLARQLDPELTPEPPPTLASARYFRVIRIKVIGAVWQCLDLARSNRVARYDIIKTSRTDLPERLRKRTAAGSKNELRADLNRSARKLGYGGAAKVRGTLQAFLHGEYLLVDDGREFVGTHFHMIVTGDLIGVVEGLRKQSGYKRTELTKTPIKAKRKLSNLAYALSYLLKSYWPAKWFGMVDGVMKRRRRQKHGRIPEPHHSNVLLWLDKQALPDLILNIGVMQDINGYRPTKKEVIRT